LGQGLDPVGERCIGFLVSLEIEERVVGSGGREVAVEKARCAAGTRE